MPEVSIGQYVWILTIGGGGTGWTGCTSGCKCCPVLVVAAHGEWVAVALVLAVP